ncbi:MAG: hypothetical protein HQ546_02360, partial [Planctomycetes bacterium]|nr:hypothetical protein [Planctomycetota bacterium]
MANVGNPQRESRFPNSFETLPCFETLEQRLLLTTYFVDQGHLSASDGNPGTEALPWATIVKAAATADEGDTVWIKEGVYRGEISSFANSSEYYSSDVQFIKLAAYQTDSVVVEGTREVQAGEWQQVGATNVYYISLPDDPNQVFVDDTRYSESLSALTDVT